MNARLFSAKINAWEVLAASLASWLGQMPFLAPLFNELQNLLVEARGTVVEQEAARAQFHESIGKRQDLERRGEDLRLRLAAHLKAQLGFRNEQLRQFGLDPLRRRRNRNGEDTEAPPPPVEDIAGDGGDAADVANTAEE